MLDLTTLVLKAGSHAAEDPNYCVMEATAVWLGEEKKDRNVDAVCPRIEAYSRALNDYLPEKDRQRLVAFIPRLPNTRGTPEQDDRRRWMLQEQATKWAGKAMRAANLIKWADTLATCSITDAQSSDSWAARTARAAREASAADAAWAARAAEAAEAAWAARAAGASWAARAAGAAWAAKAANTWDEAIALLDRLIQITESK